MKEIDVTNKYKYMLERFSNDFELERAIRRVKNLVQCTYRGFLRRKNK